MIFRRETQQFLLIAVGCIVVICNATPGDARTPFGMIQNPLSQQLLQSKYRNQKELLRLLRGGSTAEADEVEDADADAEAEADDEETNEEDSRSTPVISEKPVRLVFLTNWGSSVLDHRVEFMAKRSKDIAGLKKSLSRQLPGRPPIPALELVYEGRVLDNEMLVDELFDEDDEEEDDDETDEPTKTLIVNTLPPVDPKFATELAPKLKPHVEDDEDTLSTEEILEAYYLNQVAMVRNLQLLADPNLRASPLLRMEVQEQAKQFKELLQSQTPQDVWEASLEPVHKSHHTAQVKGQRYRSGKGGARTSLKKSIQHNLNIARPVKIWFKVLFYMMSNPPGVILSLLPAPEQAILAMDMEKYYAALYDPNGANAESNPSQKQIVRDEESKDEEESDVEEDEDEYEAETEDEEEDEDDSEDDE